MLTSLMKDSAFDGQKNPGKYGRRPITSFGSPAIVWDRLSNDSIIPRVLAELSPLVYLS